MQLTLITIVVFLFMFLQDVKAQLRKVYTPDDSNQSKGDTKKVEINTFEKADWKKIELDFLSSYYAQDGNNAAVTGGIGTEQLTDFTQKISLRIPTSPKLSWNIDAAYDYYSSASTDNIDNIRSSDSASDIRSQLTIGTQYQANNQNTFGGRLGVSTEYDYLSFNGGVNYNWLSPSQNTSIGLNFQSFIDRWMIIYPRELRRKSSVPTDRRQSYNAGISIAQVLTPRTQIAFMAEVTYMNGLLSTPFHRVYFKGQSEAKIENLPLNRMKIPLGVRVNTHLSEWLILRTYYRYYWDDWGMKAHTFNIELPVKLNRFLAIYPQYRYHTQSAVDYFKPYKEHQLDQSFYTSDYDLSALSSQHFGLGLMYSPAGGVSKIKTPFTKSHYIKIEAIELKVGHYRRSTGLTGNIGSIAIKFSF